MAKMKLCTIAIGLALAFCEIEAAFDIPPSILTSFNDSFYIDEDNDKNKEWQCGASGTQPIRYKWMKDGVNVRSNRHVTVDETTGILSILKSQYPTDFGKYQCFAHNNVGTAMSVAFNLQRTFIGPFSDTIHKNLYPVEQYHYVSLKCTGRPKCVPGSQCKLEWKKVGVKDSVQEEKRIAIDKDGTLHFLYVTVEDQSTPETPYSCVIGNEEMKAYYTGANIIMPVRQDITWKVNGVTISHVPGKYEFNNPLIMRKLKIRQLTFDDEKLYTCTASNKHGSGNAQVLLNVTSKPNLKPNETLTSVVMQTGRDATFTSGPYPSQKYLLSPDKSVLTIKNVQKEPAPGDNSVITCKTGNVIFNSNGEDMYSETYAEATLVFIEAAFDIPPSILTSFNDSFYIDEDNDKNKEWQCGASGTQPIRYKWMKDGVNVGSNRRVTVDETTGKLSILKSQYPTDFGKYQCFAHNSVGTAMSVAFNLKRTFIGSFSDTIQKNLDPVEQYHNVSLKCTGRPKCVPGSQCKLEWKKGSGIKDSVQEQKRIAIDKDGTLHFLYVTVEDQSTPETPYSCVIGNEEMKAFFKGANIIMPVRHVITPQMYRPILLSSKEAKGLVGGEAELECVFASYPLPDITWKVNGVTINHVPGKYEFDNPLIMRKLKIRQLTFDDEKLYTCTASNKHGSGNAQVLLNVTSKPYLKPNETLTSVVMQTGRDATFTCKMYSAPNERPPAAPQWFRNGNPIPESQTGPYPSQKYLLSPDKSVLTIKNVQKGPAPGDNSVITCKTGNVIFNSNGEDMYSETYAEATLVVIDEISVQVLSNLKTELKTTEPFSMAFSATTDPNIPHIYYKWRLIRDNNTFYDDTQLRSQSFVSFNADKTNLTILPAYAMGDSDYEKIMTVVGIYEVVIFHDYDTVKMKFEAYTDIAPATTGFDLWIIGVILGALLCIVLFFIIIKFYRHQIVDKKNVGVGDVSRRD